MLLPIDAVREEIVSTIKENQVTIVVGATGSGKTTRLPVFLYEACYSRKGIIGITEPRRIAATSVAKYVAEQLGTSLGDKVGFQIRFEDETSSGTKVKFMTDGILLREIQEDPDLRRYSVIMVDEAHERSVNIDFTLGLLKDLLSRRSDLKIVVSSATIDTEKFARYFKDAVVLEIPGRTFPVDVIWNTTDLSRYNMVEDVVTKVLNIHTTMPEGDILVFMDGAETINKVIEGLEKTQDSGLIALPAHGGLAPEDQRKIFEAFPGKRKIIVATNIAETSITIDGVVYVVDSGFVKQTNFNSGTGIQSLDTVPHSKAGCDQRAGRAGRTRPGICYRMYTKSSFDSREEHTRPEILRMSLASVVLTMESIGIKNVEAFDFVDQPDKKAFHEAYETLIVLGAIDKDRSALTEIGKRMASLPLDPRTARMVLEAEKYGCVEEIATIASFLSIRSVFARPKGKEEEADSKHYRFQTSSSDALTFLKVWHEYETSKFSRAFCFDNFLNAKGLEEIRNIRSQLLAILSRTMKITSTQKDEDILRSFAAGLVQNLLEHGSRFGFRPLLRETFSEVFIHPSSSVFGGTNHRWIVCSEMVTTSKTYARGVSEVKAEWLPDLVPNLFSFGELVLVSLDPEGRGVIARQDVLQKSSYFDTSTPVGQPYTRIISFDEARKIQQENIQRAHKEGWCLFQFEADRTSLWSTRMIVRSFPYRSSIFSVVKPEVGVSYYCSLEKGILGEMEANARFPLLNIPEPQKANSVPVADIASEEKLNSLRKAWGAR